MPQGGIDGNPRRSHGAALHYREERPARGLRGVIECVWEVSARDRAVRRSIERVVPDGCPELIVHLGDPFSRQTGGRWKKQPRAFLVGALSRPWLLRPGRRVHTLGIRFRPGAVTALLRIDMAAATDREVALDRLVPLAEARALVSRLASVGNEGVGRGARERAAIAFEWLLEKLARANGSSAPSAALEFVRKSHGQARVRDVAAAVGWTQRKLERSFRKHVGIGPKLYARIVRLNAVLATLDARERDAAVDLALDAGYFDQAHLLREFRALAGRTPRAGRHQDGEMARHFTRPERLRALLVGE